MNAQAKRAASASVLTKIDPGSPCLIVTGLSSIAVKAGTTFEGVTFDADTPIVPFDVRGYQPGWDYGVVIDKGAPRAECLLEGVMNNHFAGFHFAPGGNASARTGGDEVPAINPHSIWDLNFRPACPDPRGMALVEQFGQRFWCDIYLTGTDHLAKGTSRFGEDIADGRSLPKGGNGKKVKALDYATAKAIMEGHGKGLLGAEEFFAAAYGVTEKTSVGDEPEKTGLDAQRTSRFGIMQATGNMWVWGHDGDPDIPRASFFGGYWWGVVGAGSRRADLGYWDPEGSVESIGARGRCDHLQPG